MLPAPTTQRGTTPYGKGWSKLWLQASRDPLGVNETELVWPYPQMKENIQGVSNYNADQLAALKTTTTKPALNQCRMGVDFHDDTTIAYCQKNNIYYESYDALKGCPSTDSRVKAIAAAHSKTTYQICLRWVLERGCVVAAGTGNDPTTVGQYAKENLDIYGWSLTADEIATLNKIA
jgi:diketogulonate reductase-like aldo/keto reductase